MHKKSLEASKKIREEESREEESRDFRSESIAQLRARAQQHNAKLLQALTDHDKHSDNSNNSFDGSFFSDTIDTSDIVQTWNNQCYWFPLQQVQYAKILHSDLFYNINYLCETDT